MATRRLNIAAYLVVSIAIGVFGYLALFSIGFPFLLTGVLMLVLTPARRRAAIMVPALVWPWVFTLGYILVAPVGHEYPGRRVDLRKRDRRSRIGPDPPTVVGSAASLSR